MLLSHPTSSMPRWILKVVAAITVAAVLSTLAIAVVLPASAAVHEKPASCHHQKEPATPASPNYLCCQTGHQAAILPLTSVDEQFFLFMLIPQESATAATANSAILTPRTWPGSPGEPPGITALRI